MIVSRPLLPCHAAIITAFGFNTDGLGAARTSAMPLPSYTAVLLAGGDSASQKRLYPLTAGVTRALLPVGNRPLIYYSLKTFLDAGVRHAIVVAIGEKTAASINAWLAQEYTDSAHMKCEVSRVNFVITSCLRLLFGLFVASSASSFSREHLEWGGGGAKEGGANCHSAAGSVDKAAHHNASC